MTEDIIIRMYKLLDQLPQSEPVSQFEHDCALDPQLQQSWYDFLIEQYLSGNLLEVWKSYIRHIPQLKEQIAFQQSVQKGIRTLQNKALREEIQRILPKRYLKDPGKSGKGPRFYMMVISIAAIGLLCIGVLLDRFFRSGVAHSDIAEVPVLMIEPFELEGVTEDMIVHGISQQLPMKLSATEGIYPLTYYSTTHVAGRVESNQVAGVLKASYKVTGNIKRVDDALQIQASLIDIESNRAVWRDMYEVKAIPAAFNEVQDKMSTGIARALRVNVSPRAQARMSRGVSNDLEAVNLFLAGERKWSERSGESLKEAINLFRMALERDSTSALIRGYLALAYETFADNGYGTDTDWHMAIQEAEKTLIIDGENPEALVVLGYYAYAIDRDYIKAADYFERALLQQPGDAKIHQAIAELHIRTGQMDIGKEHIHIARKIEPEHRVVRWIETKYLTAFGESEEAKRAADDLMAIYPDYPNIKNFYWIYFLSTGDHAKALEAIPSERPLGAQNYMRGMVYLDHKDYTALHGLFPDGMSASFVFMEHIQRDEWASAYALLQDLLEKGEFDLLPLAQTSDFAMFTKMKSDSGIQRILAEYGIKAHLIPERTEPEI